MSRRPGADDKLDTIRSLLAQAEDPACTPDEAEAFTAKAAKLMARYGIEQAMLDASRKSPSTIQAQKISLTQPWASEKAVLLNSIARPLRCRVVAHSRRRHAPTEASVFGFPADLERVELLYTSLLLQQVNALAAQHVPYQGNTARAWRRSWLIGYAAAVGRRLTEIENATIAQAAGGSPGTDIVLADRGAQVERHMASLYDDLKSRSFTFNKGGYHDGARAGNAADLGQSRVDQSRRRRLA